MCLAITVPSWLIRMHRVFLTISLGKCSANIHELTLPTFAHQVTVQCHMYGGISQKEDNLLTADNLEQPKTPSKQGTKCPIPYHYSRY